MQTFQQVKNDYQNIVNQLIETHKGFFAFSEEQLAEGMSKIGITDRKDLTSLAHGMILPKANVDKYLLDSLNAFNTYKKTIRGLKEEKEKAILYELYNHECFYSGDIDTVVEFFKDIYSKKDIEKVFKKNRNIEEL